MPYFFLLPAFIAWLLLSGAITLTARRLPSLKPWYPYVMRVSVWATIGTLTANLILISLLALGVRSLDGLQTGTTVHDGLQVIWGLSAIFGPFAVSALGWIGGAGLGMYLALQRKR